MKKGTTFASTAIIGYIAVAMSLSVGTLNNRPHPPLVVPSLLAIDLFWVLMVCRNLCEILYSKITVVVLMKAVKDIVEDVMSIFTRWRNSVDVVE